MSALADIKEAWTNLPTWGKGAAVAGMGLLGYVLIQGGGGSGGSSVEGTYGIPTYTLDSGGNVPGTGGGTVVPSPAAAPVTTVITTPEAAPYEEPPTVAAPLAAVPSTSKRGSVYKVPNTKVSFESSTGRAPTTSQIDAMIDLAWKEQQAQQQGYAGTTLNPKPSNSYVTYKPRGEVIFQDRNEWARDNPKQAAENERLAAKPLTAHDIEVQRKMIKERPDISFGNKDIRSLGLY